ncbi:putative DBINO protein [Hordeum vulgare]|nr:putative DBINO protein [Hordeum vulgare]
MADAHPNSGGPAVDQPGMAKKKKAKAPRKPRAECTPEEIAKLDTESAKRRNWRARFLCSGRRPGEHRLVGRPVSALPVADVADHSRVARLPPAKARRPHPFLRVAGRERDRAFHPTPSACIDLNVAPGSSSGGRASVEMQRKQARPPFAGTMSSPRVLFHEMPTPMALVDNNYDQFLENVIYNGGHVPAYDPDETQS